MLRTVVRWISVASTCVPLAAAAAHVLELPNKLTLDGPLWLVVQQQLYRNWGTIIGPFEVIAVLSTWGLVFVMRDRPPIRALATIAALCLTAMIAVFFALNAPVNAAVAQWSADALPADWHTYRLRWEIGHAVAFLLGLTALLALVRAAYLDAVEAQRQPKARRPVVVELASRRRPMRTRGVVSLRTARE
jgi:hypothetical protein